MEQRIQASSSCKVTLGCVAHSNHFAVEVEVNTELNVSKLKKNEVF